MTGGNAVPMLRVLASTILYVAGELSIAGASQCDMYFVESHSLAVWFERGKKTWTVNVYSTSRASRLETISV